MGDEAYSDYLATRRRALGVAPPQDPGKARAIRRANVAQDIADGLIVEPRGARNSDPETSHEAIAIMRESGALAGHQRIAYDAVHRWPGSTAPELGAATGLGHVEIQRRLSDLAGRTPPLIVKGNKRKQGRFSYVTWWPPPTSQSQPSEDPWATS